jgi:outer membrane protein assembly factor BamB
MSKNKTATAIALFLLFAMTISLIALPTVNAQGRQETYFVFGVTPNPVGVNQEVIILVGITQQLYSALYGWSDLSVTVTRPDGIIETLDEIKTDSTGMTGVNYRPSMAGNYTLVGHFPEQVIEPGGGASFFGFAIPDGTTMLASNSDPITLVVQEEPIQYYPTLPLPTEYWTRPIDDQLREWAPIAGNWLTIPLNCYAIGNDDAPDTAHVLWAKPLTTGGLVGGALNPYSASDEDISNVGSETGDAYEGKWSGSIIQMGKLYYQKYAANDKYKETICVDLHTGEELWSRVLLDNLTLLRGQTMFWQTYDNQGIYDYLWATGPRAFFAPDPGIMYAFDPFTGDYVYGLYSVPSSGTFDYGPKGEMLYYTIDLRNGYMLMWNSTNIPQLYASTNYASMAWGQWQPMGKYVNATGPADVNIGGGMFGMPPPPDPYTAPQMPLDLAGYNWNVTIPKGLPGSVRAVFTGDKIVGADINQTHVVAWGLNLNPSEGTIGELLYKEAWRAPGSWVDGNQSISFGAISNIDGVFTVNAKESRLRYGFSSEDGTYKWVISEPIAMLGHLTGGPNGENGFIAYGKLFCGTVSGVLQAYDVTDGKLAWTYDLNDPYQQVLWSNNFPMGQIIIADGKIYIANEEHSVNQPLPRGGPFACINATTGEVIWRVNGMFRQTVWGGEAVIGDSIIATMDTYDQRVYAIGKGPSALAVSAGPKTSVEGSSVLVEGMVTDVSPGTNSAGLAMRFPNGVPAVADENMSDWMLYVYKQFAKPADVIGVEVVVTVLDPNNNNYEVGRATSDANGFFHCAFTPPVPGEYTIYANFEGSGAYYGSSAETAINVDSAPAETPPPTPTPAPMTDTYVLGIGTAAIIAIVVIGLILILMLRKR